MTNATQKLTCGYCLEQIEAGQKSVKVKAIGDFTVNSQNIKNVFSSGCTHNYHSGCMERISLLFRNSTEQFCQLCSPQDSSQQDDIISISSQTPSTPQRETKSTEPSTGTVRRLMQLLDIHSKKPSKSQPTLSSSSRPQQLSPRVLPTPPQQQKTKKPITKKEEPKENEEEDRLIISPKSSLRKDTLSAEEVFNLQQQSNITFNVNVTLASSQQIKNDSHTEGTTLKQQTPSSKLPSSKPFKISDKKGLLLGNVTKDKDNNRIITVNNPKKTTPLIQQPVSTTSDKNNDRIIPLDEPKKNIPSIHQPSSTTSPLPLKRLPLPQVSQQTITNLVDAFGRMGIGTGFSYGNDFIDHGTAHRSFSKNVFNGTAIVSLLEIAALCYRFGAAIIHARKDSVEALTEDAKEFMNKELKTAMRLMLYATVIFTLMALQTETERS